jgi:hypothetical protein
LFQPKTHSFVSLLFAFPFKLNSVDQPFNASAYAYDVEVEVDDPTRQRMKDFLRETSHSQDIQRHDEEVSFYS